MIRIVVEPGERGCVINVEGMGPRTVGEVEWLASRLQVAVRNAKGRDTDDCECPWIMEPTPDEEGYKRMVHIHEPATCRRLQPFVVPG